MKENNIRYIRYGVQVLGILLTIISFFTNYPIASSVLLGVTLILGPVFCGWICPFGTLQDVFAKLGAKLGIKKLVMPANLKKVLAFFRYILLIITILISADFIFTILSLDPRANITTLLGGKMLTVMGWVIIVVFLGISMFFERPFCNYLCVEGAKFGVLSTLRPLTIVRNKETCVGCNKCNRACPMNIDISSYGQVRSLQCINCIECVAACPVKNTLKVGLTPVIEHYKKVAIVSIAAAFLIVVYTKINTNSIFKIFTKNNSTSTTTSTAITGNTAATYGDASGIADGSYIGTGTGFRGSMTVEVTVKDEIITGINVTQHSEDAKWFNRAYNTIASKIISSQTADVDAVSGATYSSMGIKQGVANALINAGGKNVKTIVNDLPAAGKNQHGKRK